MMRGPETVKRTLDLFRFVRERFGFTRARVILSGRALGERLAPENAPHVAQDLAPMENWLALEGVNERAGAAILRQLDKDYDSLPDPAQRLAAARALNGHPLALKIFQLYVRDKDPATIATILSDLHADEGFAKETALRFLYGRILERLSTPEVKAIARPGLILRRVSPDLIRLVLAGPCGLGEIDAARASELFAQLVSNYWLIEEHGAGVARHRADLRRQMLPALLKDMPEKALALNQRAAAYYEQGPAPEDPDYAAWRALDPDERDAEAIYHRALAEETPPPEFETGRARRIRDQLGEDLPMLEKRWRVVILASARSWREIDEAWIDAKSLAPLSPALRAELTGRVSEAMISSGDAPRARQILELSPTGEMTPVDEDADVSGLEQINSSNTSLGELGLQVQASFNQADIARAAAYAKMLLDLHLFAYSRNSSGNYTNVFWLAALAVAATDRSYQLKKIGIDPLHFDSKTWTAIEVLLTGAFDSIAPSDRPKFLETYLSEHRSSLDTLDLAVLLSALDLSHYSPNMSVRLLKNRASLRFLFDALLEESGSDEPRIALGVLTSKAMRDLGDAPAKAQIDRVYSADDAVTFYLPGDWDLVTPDSLRGLSPELHEPAAFVLTECGSQDIHVWIEEVAAKAPWWPSDLRFEGEGRPRFDKRDAFSVVVSADRCGLLRDLLQWLAARDGRARDLFAIHDIVTERLFSFTRSL